MHDIEATLRIVRILLELHHALLDSKRDNDFCLRWNNQSRNRHNTLLALLFKAHVILLNYIVFFAYELGYFGRIPEESHPDS